MTTTQIKIIEKLQDLPETALAEVLELVDQLANQYRWQDEKSHSYHPSSEPKIPRGTLTGLLGLIKTNKNMLTDVEIQDVLEDALMDKYL